MTASEKKKRYTEIYKEADAILKKYDPCHFEKGRCRFHPEQISWCCNKCQHLTKHGCKAQSLFCKLSLCTYAQKEYKECYQKLRDLHDRAWCSVPYGFRASKNQNFGRTKRR